MRNITVSVDDETHRLARIRAAELDTSVSALVREYLQALADADFLQGDREAVARRPIRDVQELVEFRRRLLREFFEDFDRKGLDPRDNLPRDELYDRARARAEIAEARAGRGSEDGREICGYQRFPLCRDLVSGG